MVPRSRPQNLSAQITGGGAVTHFGFGVEPLWQAVMNGATPFDQGISRIPTSIWQSLHEQGPPNATSFGSAFLLCWSALHQALKGAGWDQLRSDDGLVLATTTGQIVEWERSLSHLLTSPSDNLSELKKFMHVQSLGSLRAELVKQLEFRGPTLLLTSACSASTQALGMALEWLRQGRVRRCLVGAVETICDLTVHGFSGLKLLSPTAARPFDQARTGINLAEGAGFMCLEINSSATKSSLAQLQGFGLSGDAHHMTAPQSEGEGCVRAMRAALNDANCEPSDIAWIHAHGTGSQSNDLAEGKALLSLFEGAPIVTSTKRSHGHFLGASGLLETLIVTQALQTEIIPACHGLQNPDATLHKLNLAKSPLAAATARRVLKNTLGFGGVNASLVLGR